MKLATIVSDASFCHNTKAGGWAAWVVCENIRYQKSDIFKTKCNTSSEAEVLAAINGIWLATKHFKNVERFHVVSDCQHVINLIENQEGNEWKEIKKIVGKAVVTAKWVKSHDNNNSARSWVNRWCDKHAKKKMREQKFSN